jgi:hypothetical protein
MLADDLMDCKKLFEDGTKIVEVESVGSVGLGMLRIVVDLEEDAVDACGHGSTGEDGDELRLAA